MDHQSKDEFSVHDFLTIIIDLEKHFSREQEEAILKGIIDFLRSIGIELPAFAVVLMAGLVGGLAAVITRAVESFKDNDDVSTKKLFLAFVSRALVRIVEKYKELYNNQSTNKCSMELKLK